MNQTISANELKTKGVSAISRAISDDTEALITVRGKTQYVVLSISAYNHLRECELEAALLETRKDIRNRKYVVESAEKHMKRISRG